MSQNVKKKARMEAPYWHTQCGDVLCPWMCIPGCVFLDLSFMLYIECACDDYACMQSDWSIATGLSADSRAYENPFNCQVV